MKLWMVMALFSLGVLAGVFWLVLPGRGRPPLQPVVPSASTSPAGLPSVRAQGPSIDSQPTCRVLTHKDDAGTSVRELAGNMDATFLQNESTLLPFQTIQLSDIHALFAPHYEGEAAKRLLTPELRAALEQAVYQGFRWRLEGNAEAFMWRQRQVHEFLYGEVLSNPPPVSAHQLEEQRRAEPGRPIQATGFADIPFVVTRDRPLDILGEYAVAHLNDKTRTRLDKEMTVVTVYSAARTTPSGRRLYPFVTTSMVFVYDPDVKAPIFYPLVTEEKTSHFVNAEIPAFFRGRPLQLQ